MINSFGSKITAKETVSSAASMFMITCELTAVGPIAWDL